jgi:hypothetical protein
MEIDDRTVAYITAAHKHFEDLKQVAAQLAGFLVLSASGSRSALPDHPMLISAEQLARGAADGIRTARVTPRAGSHHRHLVTASAELDNALASARKGADPLRSIEAAYRELRAATRALPGFEMISFERGCCA